MVPNPRRCEDLEVPAGGWYGGVAHRDGDGVVEVYVSSRTSTCTERYGCSLDGAVGYGSYVRVELGARVVDVGGYAIDGAEIKVDCGGCIGDGEDNGEEGGAPVLEGHVEITRLDDQRVVGCVLPDQGCDPQHFDVAICQ